MVKDASIADLWELDVLGIIEPTEKQSRQQRALAAKELFLQTVTRDEEGRYEVRLPRLEGHPPLPTNLKVARKRLTKTVQKLSNDKMVKDYELVFKEWLEEGTIEKVCSQEAVNQGHFLPHRPVIKENSLTTKIRPVFDASASEKQEPSLNLSNKSCFRSQQQSFSSRANYRTPSFGEPEELRSERVAIQPGDNKETCQEFYIDNCVTSVASEMELKQFMKVNVNGKI